MASRNLAIEPVTQELCRQPGWLPCCHFAWLALLAWPRPLMLPDEGRYVGVAWETMRSWRLARATLNGLALLPQAATVLHWITAASTAFGPGD